MLFNQWLKIVSKVLEVKTSNSFTRVYKVYCIIFDLSTISFLMMISLLLKNLNGVRLFFDI